jgi:hypothetical protein
MSITVSFTAASQRSRPFFFRAAAIPIEAQVRSWCSQVAVQVTRPHIAHLKQLQAAALPWFVPLMFPHL